MSDFFSDKGQRKHRPKEVIQCGSSRSLGDDWTMIQNAITGVDSLSGRRDFIIDHCMIRGDAIVSAFVREAFGKKYIHIVTTAIDIELRYGQPAIDSQRATNLEAGKWTVHALKRGLDEATSQ